MQKTQERANTRRGRHSRVGVGGKRHEMFDYGEHVLARHRGKRLSRTMRVVPGEDAAGDEEQPLASPGLKTANTP
jgi:hypothetical protein